jgi:tetratricopeptide (TPR) repeat protein
MRYVLGFALLALALPARAECPDPAKAASTQFDQAEAALKSGDEQGALDHYTKAVQLAPTEASYYAALADLYARLRFQAEAEKTLAVGLKRVTDDKKKYVLYSLYGELLSNAGNDAAAMSLFESAKHACGYCGEAGQQIVFFNLGVAYAMQKPPRKAEAMSNLQSFYKMICKGAAAHRYADQCAQAQLVMAKLGNP